MRPFQHLAVALVALTLASSVAVAGEDVPKGLRGSDWSGIRAAYETNRHAVFADAGGYVAHNPGQQWRTTFDGCGFITTPDAGDWSWGLELLRDGVTPVSNPCEFMNTCGQRVEYVWDDNLTEWYINDGRGLEHGYTVARRPNEQSAAQQSPDREGEIGLRSRQPSQTRVDRSSTTVAALSFTLAVRGNLCPRISGDGCSVTFINETGAAVVSYSGLTVFDATSAALPAWFETGDSPAAFSSRNLFAPADSPFIHIVIDDTAAVYPITIDPIAQQAYLKASNTGAGDRFGWSVAVSGDTVVVGAVGEDSSATGVNGNQANNSFGGAGAAYVFVRSDGVWSQQAFLKASNPAVNDEFGCAVAISGDTVVIGAHREGSNATGVNGNQNNNSALSSGAAYIFVRSGGSWTQQTYVKASNTGADDHFGRSVAIDGDTVVVGAYEEDCNAIGVDGNQADNSAVDSGAAYVFVRSGGNWTQQAYFKASNTGGGDWFGQSVDVSGDIVMIGAPLEDSSATGLNGNQVDNSTNAAGAAYVFVRSDGVWTQQAYLKASNSGAINFFGQSVAISGDTVVVAARGEDSSAIGVNGNQADNSAFNSGAAYVYVRSGSVWSQQAYLKASNTEETDNFGISVAIDGDTVVVGARDEDSYATGVNGNQTDNSLFSSGAVYIFNRDDLIWSQQTYLKASNTAAMDWFGVSAAISGDMVVVGAFFEDSVATGINGNQADNSAEDSGAAYVFTGVGPDRDGDGIPDPVDADVDGDGLENEIDACPAASACVHSDPTGRPWSDLNADCFVNGLDVQELADCIGSGACSEVDPDGDGMSVDVDMADDIAAFVAATLAPVAAPCP